MADRFIWRGGDGDFTDAAQWTDQTTGLDPAPAPPSPGDSATLEGWGVTVSGVGVASNIDIRGAVELTGTLRALDALTLDGTLSLRDAWLTAERSSVAAGSTLSGSGRIGGPLANDGVMLASGGALALFGAISGAGTLAIGGSGTLFAAATVAASIRAQFVQVGGTLGLFTPQGGFAAPIVGFAPGDAIDIAGTRLTGAAWASGTLTLEAPSGAVGALVLTGDYAESRFVAVPDGIDGSLILLAPTATGVAAARGSAGHETFVWQGGVWGAWANAGNWTGPLHAAPGVTNTATFSTPDFVFATGRASVMGITVLGRVGFTDRVDSLSVAVASAPAQLALLPGATLHATTVTIAGTLTVQGLLQAGSLILTGGVLTVAPAGVAAVGGAGRSAGMLNVVGPSVSGWGTLDAPLVDNASVTAAGGVLTLTQGLTGPGTVAIADGATLFLPRGGAADVVFRTASGTLMLFASAAGFHGTVFGLVPGDVIDIAASTVSQAVFSQTGEDAGELTLRGLDGDAGTISLQGEYRGWTWTAAADGQGGTAIELIACFAAGTRIATPGGTVAVEHLRPGHKVLTPDGPRRLRWVGASIVDSRVAPEARPVRIRPGALGAGRPSKDLVLSPHHALLRRGRLVPAITLPAGRCIRREPGGQIRYWHLALAGHSVVKANGVWAETFRPEGGVARFTQEWGRRPPPSRPYARIDEERGLERCRAGRDGPLHGHVERTLPTKDGLLIEGWAWDEHAPHRAVSLEAVCGTRRIATLRAGLWRPDLDRAGLGWGRCAFRLYLPHRIGPFTIRRATDGTVLPVFPGAVAYV